MKALVFDYDGLIVDSETPEFLCWQATFEEHGQRLVLDDWIHVIGGAVTVDMRAELERRLGRPLDWEPVNQRRLALHARLFGDQDLLPGVRGLIEKAASQGWSIGVASNSSFGWVERGLDRFGLRPYVGAIRSRDTAKRPKPHPDPYAEVLAELGAKPELSFGFEDSAPGVASAKAAGLTVVAVPNSLTRHQDLSAAHRILDSLEQFELPE